MIWELYVFVYVEGDVIGFYINLFDGVKYVLKYELYVNKVIRVVFCVLFEKEDGFFKCVLGLILWIYFLVFLYLDWI